MKTIFNNIIITLAYFAFCLLVGSINKDGGSDIFIEIILFFASLIHIFILLNKKYSEKKYLFYALLGFLIGILVSIVSLYMIDQNRNKIEQEVIIGYLPTNPRVLCERC